MFAQRRAAGVVPGHVEADIDRMRRQRPATPGQPACEPLAQRVAETPEPLANAFGATRTPHCFLFDKNGKLVYRGAIDDNIKDPNEVKEHYLKDAILAVAGGKQVKTNSTKSIGCSIKRVGE